MINEKLLIEMEDRFLGYYRLWGLLLHSDRYKKKKKIWSSVLKNIALQQQYYWET